MPHGEATWGNPNTALGIYIMLPCPERKEGKVLDPAGYMGAAGASSDGFCWRGSALSHRAVVSQARLDAGYTRVK